ncbi:MAG: roadblock/LC7 domain-containing protein, partial [bacterium]
MPPIGPADANIGFTLTGDGRTRLVRVLDAFAAALPSASAILIDKAGRIVEIARKPLGVKLEAIAALASACHASTHELAHAMKEDEFALLFENEDEQQVYVWPVADRALLVILVKGAAAVDALEQHMDGALGKELIAVIAGARDTLQAVPPPRPPAIAILEKVTTRGIGYPATTANGLQDNAKNSTHG